MRLLECILWGIVSSSEYSSVNEEEDKLINDVFLITGVKHKNFNSYLKENDLSLLSDERREGSLKMEVLDHYPGNKANNDHFR